MKTFIQRYDTGITIQIKGYLNFEATTSLRTQLDELISDSGSQITFDFQDLHFVGSSGITAFIQALREFNGRATMKPRYINVKNEFRRLISALDSGNTFDLDDFNSNARSIRSLDQ